MSINTQRYHRMNICIEVPAVGGDFPKTGMSRFSDIIDYVKMISERGPQEPDARIEIAGCIATFGVEFNVNSELKPELWADNREAPVRVRPDEGGDYGAGETTARGKLPHER